MQPFIHSAVPRRSYTGGEGCNGTDPGPDHGNPGPNPPGVRCPGQTQNEYISEFSIWAIAGGQVYLSALAVCRC